MGTLTIPARFCGPSGSANGGYTCGRLAALAGTAVTVRLVRPSPLDTPLAVATHGALTELRHRDVLIAEARPGDVGPLQVPTSPGYDAARQAMDHYTGYSIRHPAPQCFVCGPRRPHQDGLGIFPGAVEAPGVVAAAWTPAASLDAGDGLVAPEFHWAVLDCPGYHAVTPDVRPMLLGEMTAEITRRVAIGEPCVVVGWPLGSERRKYYAGTALYGADGKLCGRARAIWIELRSNAP